MPRKKTKKTKLSPAEKKDRIRLRDRARKARKREDPEVRGKENAQQRARREDLTITDTMTLNNNNNHKLSRKRKALIDAKRHEAKSRRKLNEKNELRELFFTRSASRSEAEASLKTLKASHHHSTRSGA
ncbi:hypothetical protein THAOC_31725, partial [Thalassiosira oceanica]